MGYQVILEIQYRNLGLLIELHQLRSKADSSHTHQHYSWWNLLIFGSHVSPRILLEHVELLLIETLEPLPSNPALELIFPL